MIGSCYVLLGFDLGFQIDLDAASKLMTETTERMTIIPRHRAPKHFEYRSKPLRVSQRADPVTIGEFATLGAVDLTVYDFGAVSFAYRIPFKTNLSSLLELSDALYDNIRLKQDAQLRVADLLAAIRPAVVKSNITDLVEDYLIFEIVKRPHDPEPDEVLEKYPQEIAQILRSEKLPLAEQQISDALAEQIQYTSHDTAIINWNAAFHYGEDAEDVRSVLEFINVQLLEMRQLDSQLDKALEQSYDVLTRRQSSYFRLLHPYNQDLKNISQLQVDGALLFEGVTNALKLLGDQYLSRVYRVAARRFHLADWDGNLVRKLNTLESIYEKLQDQMESARMQLMEFTIVILILFEIVWPWIQG